MGNAEPLRLDTDRLLLRETVSGDLADLRAVFASNPDFLSMRREFATYDLESLTRYWEAAALDPARHVLVVTDRNTGSVVGLVDFVDQSPADGKPWIGLVMVHRSRQRLGYGTEAVNAIADLVGSRGHRAVRMAVMEDNEAGLAFADQMGFEAFRLGDSAAQGASGGLELLELTVDPGAG